MTTINMKKSILFLILLIIALPIITVFKFKNEYNNGTIEETTYSLDGDYVIGKTLIESQNYSRNYELDRKQGLNRMMKSAKNGFADAQYYLAEIYLNDNLLYNNKLGLVFMKKSAFQHNKDAIKYLSEKKIKYFVRPNPKFKFEFKHFEVLLILHLITSVFLNIWLIYNNLYKANKSKIPLIWLLPFLGGILTLITLKKNNH